MSTELAVIDPKELYRISTDVAGLCKEAVVKTVMKIGGKNYVKVEGWQTIAAAHGCLAEIESIAEAEIEGVRGLICWTKLVRISDQAVLSRASAFLGDDENQDGISGKKYARYAKVQTRAISRVCSNAFRFVVVLMNAGLETTPAEEMPREPACDPSGYETDAKGFARSVNAPTPRPPDEIQEIMGELKETWENKGWTYGVVTGIQFSTQKEDIALAIRNAQGNRVRVTAKKIIQNGRIKFRPQSVEILDPSPTESEKGEEGQLREEQDEK